MRETIINKLRNTGKLEPFEINNSSLVLAIVGIGLYIYSLIIFYFNPEALEIKGARELFTILFLISAFIPFTKNKFVLNNYGWIVFISLFLFDHYLIYTSYINNFSLDYLLGTYVITFGVILMASNRLLIMLFCSTQLLHMIQKVFISNLDQVAEAAIIMSQVTIFLFFFIIYNGFGRYRKNLLKININLENKIKERTIDLENRARELEGKNKDLEQFAYVVSHDLKRPVRNIYSISQWLIDDHKDEFEKDIITNLDLIKEQATQMDLLIEGILDYSLSKESESIIKEVNLNELVDRFIAVNSTKNCTIKILNKLPIIKINEAQILQVFQNLIQNAIKYNDKKITFIEVDYKEAKDNHLFSIKDNGPGIEKKYHDKIFQLFQKLVIDANIESIGIGLAMVKKIINAHNGEVWLESEMGKGTIFYFTISK